MKKLIFTMIAMVIATTSFAQPDGQRPQRMDPKEMIAKRTEDMTKKYNLSSEQAEKVKALNEKFMSRRGPRPEANGQERPKQPRQGMGGGGNHRGGGFGGMRKHMEEYNNELKQIMTEEQYKAYTTDMEKMREERKGRQGGQQ